MPKSKKVARLSCHVTLSETKGLVFPMTRCFACAQHDMGTDFDMALRGVAALIDVRGGKL